ncbi:MAG: hypothetical protein KAY37_15675 [Phycisphaerae bacterium]|nr:hypothetical protein [Phycisphaerae bacterium]
MTDAFIRAAEEIQKLTHIHDGQAFRDMFAEVRQYFGDFTEQALQQSDFLIDRLVERK